MAQCDLAIEIHAISMLDSPNQPLTRSKELGICVYDTLECFWKMSECNTVGLLFLMFWTKW